MRHQSLHTSSQASVESTYRVPRYARGARAGLPSFLGGRATPDHATIAQRLDALVGGGRALDASARAQIEPHVGVDLSSARVHEGGPVEELTGLLDADAFTVGRDMFFRSGMYAPGRPEGLRLVAHEAAHVAQAGVQPTTRGAQRPHVVPSGALAEREADGVAASVGAGAVVARPALHTVASGGAPMLFRKGKGEGGEGGTPTGAVGPEGGESQTPSNLGRLARGYTARTDGRFDSPYGRVVSAEQALAESRVVESEGVFLGVYLARYAALSKYGLSAAELDTLSADAGFLKQFQTGDVVMRMMDAEDSAGIGKVTESSYSHSGIVQVKSGRVWVLDSYPGRRVTVGGAAVEDSTQLIRFEEFFGDHDTEKILHGIVLRPKGLNDELRRKIDAVITAYDVSHTKFDRDFLIDSDKATLYCSELVWRVLSEAGSPSLPANELPRTREKVQSLIEMVKVGIALAKSQKTDATQLEKQLALLTTYLNTFNASGSTEMYSPGSFERGAAFEAIAGFTRGGKFTGDYAVTILRGTVPDDTWDTPDAYVWCSGTAMFGGSSRTTTRDDTTRPEWNERLTTVGYDALRSMSLMLYDEDTLSDDLLATFVADLRPSRPAGQTFELAASGATLQVQVAATLPAVAAVQAPREM